MKGNINYRKYTIFILPCLFTTNIQFPVGNESSLVLHFSKFVLQYNCLGITTANLHMQRTPDLLASFPLCQHLTDKSLRPRFIPSFQAQFIRHGETVSCIFNYVSNILATDHHNSNIKLSSIYFYWLSKKK